MKSFAAFAIVCLLATLCTGCSKHAKGHSMSASHIGNIRHVVFFKFKDGTPAEKIREIEIAFAGLKAKIPTIIDYEWGTNNSPEPHSRGYTHCFLVTFANEADRDAYLPHPAHGEFVALAGPHIGEVHVIDYVARATAGE